MKTDKILSYNKLNYDTYKENVDTYGTVDLETGEIIDTFPVGTKVIKPKPEFIERADGSEYKNKFNQGKKELFVKMYKNPIKELSKELSYKDLAIFTMLTPYIGYQDCILKDNDGLGKPVNIKQLSELINVNYDILRKTLKDFEKKELIAKIAIESKSNSAGKINVIAVNPYIFFNGVDLRKEIYLAFKNSKWAILNVNY